MLLRLFGKSFAMIMRSTELLHTSRMISCCSLLFLILLLEGNAHSNTYLQQVLEL